MGRAQVWGRIMVEESRSSGGRSAAIDDRIRGLALDLSALDRELIRSRVDVHAIEEFSKAVDHIRNTIWAMLNSADMTESFIEAGSAAGVLTALRVQRATSLGQLVVEEIDAGSLTPKTKGVDDLRKILAVAYKKLSRLLKQPVESE